MIDPKHGCVRTQDRLDHPAQVEDSPLDNGPMAERKPTSGAEQGLPTQSADAAGGRNRRRRRQEGIGAKVRQIEGRLLRPQR